MQHQDIKFWNWNWGPTTIWPNIECVAFYFSKSLHPTVQSAAQWAVMQLVALWHSSGGTMGGHAAGGIMGGQAAGGTMGGHAASRGARLGPTAGSRGVNGKFSIGNFDGGSTGGMVGKSRGDNLAGGSGGG